jgi:hypothetical protein
MSNTHNDARQPDRSGSGNSTGGNGRGNGGSHGAAAEPHPVETKPGGHQATLGYHIVVTLAAFMEVLDTTIVNVAPPHIVGTMSPATTKPPGH